MVRRNPNHDLGLVREHEAVILRTAMRLTFKQIADELGCDVKTAHSAWKRGVEALAKEAAASHGQYVGEQLATVRELINGMMPRVRSGDSKAAEAVVRAMDHEAKLLGLYAPIRANVTVTDEMTARIKALADEIAQLEET